MCNLQGDQIGHAVGELTAGACTMFKEKMVYFLSIPLKQCTNDAIGFWFAYVQ